MGSGRNRPALDEHALKSRYVKEGRHKLIQTPYRNTEERYDLAADPNELHNLLKNPSPEVIQVAARLRAKLESWAESADPLPSKFEMRQHLETIERLKALGYL